MGMFTGTPLSVAVTADASCTLPLTDTLAAWLEPASRLLTLLVGLRQQTLVPVGVDLVELGSVEPGTLQGVGSIATSALQIVTETDALREQMESATPLRRIGMPEEIAATVLFLASPRASYVNGAEIHINGGQHV